VAVNALEAWKKLGSPGSSFETWMNLRWDEYCLQQYDILPERALVSSAEFKDWFDNRYGYLDSVKLD